MQSYARIHSILAATSHPPRPGELVDWTKPLFDSDGYEHALVAMNSSQVITSLVGRFVVWDRKLMVTEAEGTASDGGQLKISNTPMPAEELQRRRAHGLVALEGLRQQSTALERQTAGRQWLQSLAISEGEADDSDGNDASAPRPAA